ncbi:uncharacterized protein TNCV_3357621 [Trichonephila clavipes]|nr:uncharacterized protein TNCV_3357621 [Trichonephila clavipes]
MPSIEGYHPYGLASILTELECNRACVGYAWPTNCCRQPPPTWLLELRRALLDEWYNIPQDQIDNLILSMPRRYGMEMQPCCDVWENECVFAAREGTLNSRRVRSPLASLVEREEKWEGVLPQFKGGNDRNRTDILSKLRPTLDAQSSPLPS